MEAIALMALAGCMLVFFMLFQQFAVKFDDYDDLQATVQEDKRGAQDRHTIRRLKRRMKAYQCVVLIFALITVYFLWKK